MNGVHDMGGMQGFGTVCPEENEPVFHHVWEGRMLALQRAMGFTGAWNIDASRAAQEQLPPADYLAASYYKRWALGMTFYLLRSGLVDPIEIEAGHAISPPAKVARVMRGTDVLRAFTRGKFSRDTGTKPSFCVGDTVRARRMNPDTHTRLPRYARGCVGQIEAVRGCHVLPDTNSLGTGENPQWLYTVVFSGQALWGQSADPTLKVSIEAFEPYLESA